MIATILSAGIQTTIQDCGRTGSRKFGVALGGALDSFALRTVNLLVGNEECAAGFELADGTLRLRFDDDRLIAYAGGQFECLLNGSPAPTRHCLRVPAGSLVEVKAQRSGRCWIAVSGGVDVPPVLGSRATDLRAAFGGYVGRALRDGDQIPIGHELPCARHIATLISGSRSSWSAPALNTPLRTVRVIPGRHWEDLDGEAQDQFLGKSLQVDPRSDRMGVRLDGVTLPSPERELVSEAVAPGTVQLPPDGAPIVLLADCQTIGGYARIAHVITVDLARAAQWRPLDEVRFEMVTLEHARELRWERGRDLAFFRAGLKLRLQ